MSRQKGLAPEMQTFERLGQGAGQARMIRIVVLSGVGLSRSTWSEYFSARVERSVVFAGVHYN